MDAWEWSENEKFQKTVKTAYTKAAIAIAGGAPAADDLKLCGQVFSGTVNLPSLALGLATVTTIYDQLESDPALVTVDFIYSDVSGQFPVYAKALAAV